jgi:hypothetical protein
MVSGLVQKKKARRTIFAQSTTHAGETRQTFSTFYGRVKPIPVTIMNMTSTGRA